jgi:hypothetical protein
MSEGTNSGRPALTREYMGISDGLPLEASGGGIDELRRDIQHLMDIEAIKQVKHAYFRCLDTANWSELATLFHEDITVHFKGGSYEWKLEGREAYIDAVRGAFNQQAVGHHNGHHPEIRVESETEATGIWYLADNMWILNAEFLTGGTALYWDRYEKADGKWRIRHTRYERIYETNQKLDRNPPLSSHYLGAHGSEVA